MKTVGLITGAGQRVLTVKELITMSTFISALTIMTGWAHPNIPEPIKRLPMEAVR